MRSHTQPASLLTLVLALAAIVQAEQLPIRTYTAADGLPANAVNRIVRDSHGFLWFCTPEGLSRFDGYTFTNYGTGQGLPTTGVYDFLETNRSEYWVATRDGLCRFNPTPSARHVALETPRRREQGRAEPRFVVYSPPGNEDSRNVQVLLEDHQGTLWCGTAGGLYRLAELNGRWTFDFVDFGSPRAWRGVSALLEDAQGALWIGTLKGLYRRWPDGRTERYTTRQGLPSDYITALLQDRERRLFVGTKRGLCLVAIPA